MNKQKSILTKGLMLIASVINLFSNTGVFAYSSVPSGSVTTSDGYQWPFAAPVNQTELNKDHLHGLTIGTLDQYKKVQNSSEVSIPDLSHSIYVISYDDVTVYRQDINHNTKQTIVGKALSFSDKNLDADNGYILVDLTEAYKWIDVFNGDPNYVFSGNVIHTYEIMKGNGTKLYDAFNLAEIAAACGGSGGDFGFNPVGGGYVSYTDYHVTPRPSYGSISTPKSTYNLGEDVTFNPTATDYSIYDKGLEHVSFSVINKTLNKGFKQLLNTTTQTIDSYTIDPTYGPGTYEVTWIYTDKHGRTPQGSTDMSTALPVTATFQVIDGTGGTTPCTPTSATLKITGNPDQTISPGSSKELPANINTVSLVFPVEGTLSVGNTQLPASTQFNNVLINGSTTFTFNPTDSSKCSMTFTLVPTGGSTIECITENVSMHIWTSRSDTNAASGGTLNVDQGERVTIDSTIQGDFFYKYGGSQRDEDGWLKGSSSNTTSYEISNLLSSGANVHVKFVSTTGQRCWYKTFVVLSEEQPVDCPKVYQPSDSGWANDTADPIIEKGTTINRNLGDTLKLYSKYYDPNSNRKFDADVHWMLTYPDGTTKQVSGHMNDRGSFAAGLGHDISVVLNQKGTYTLKHNYTDTSQFRDCSWSISIFVDDTISCSDLQAIAYSSESGFTYTGSGTVSDPYTGARDAGEKVWTTFEASYQGVKIPANWEISGGNLSTPIKIQDRTSYQNFLTPLTTPTTYTIKATITYRGITCVKIFYVVFSPYSCSETSISANVNGSNVSMQDETLHLVLGKAPSYKVDFKALYSSSPTGVTGDWTLKKNGSSGSTTVVGQGTFSHTFTDSTPATYTLTVKVKIGSTVCLHTITINIAGIQCSDLSLYFFNGSTNDWHSVSNGTTKGVTVSGDLDWKVVVTDGKAPNYGGKLMNVAWTASLPNQSSTPSTSYQRSHTPKGSYTVTATVNDPAYPQLAGCQFTFTLEISDNLIGCEELYLHFWDSATNEWKTAVPKGSTITIPAEHVDQLGLVVGNEADDYIGYLMAVDWTGSTKPNEFDEPIGYVINNVGAGTYTIKGKVIDPKYPNAIGCTFTLTVMIGSGSSGETPPPGGDNDGGRMTINIYDSSNRKLTSTADGTWEREPARIEVLIEQAKIHSAFTAVDGKIKQAMDEKIAEFKAKYPAPTYEKVTVTAQPVTWHSQTNAMTKWPATLPLSVTGPGMNSTYSLNPKLASQSNIYSGTTTPTLTTWNSLLNGQDYVVKVDAFTIDVPYKVNFDVKYDKCEMIDDPKWTPDPDDPDAVAPKIKKCTPGTDSGQINNTFTITVQGDQTSFEVFEPNASGLLQHTSEWAEYHARDRYKNSQPNDFYAGERIIAHLQLEDRQRHPVSKLLPQIQSVSAWISETGKSGGNLQSQLSLVAETSALWVGAKQNVQKLGPREMGVDTSLMGDKVKGFAKGSQYAVYYQVHFAFGVSKGFAPYNKTMVSGHNQTDYKIPFLIIGNAWERQGIRNHTKQ